MPLKDEKDVNLKIEFEEEKKARLSPADVF